jgi:hypothetical protein
MRMFKGVDDYTKERMIHELYEWGHILNDALAATLFLIGSIFFLYEDLTHAGTWLFIFGSAQLAVGPLIRIANKLHVRRFRKPPIHW